MMTMFGT